MAEDSLDKMAEIAAADSQQAFRRRLDKERSFQTRMRRIRWTLRLLLLVAGLGLILAFYMDWMAVGLACMAILFVCAPILFIMGGLAVGRVRLVLSDREKRLADD